MKTLEEIKADTADEFFATLFIALGTTSMCLHIGQIIEWCGNHIHVVIK